MEEKHFSYIVLGRNLRERLRYKALIQDHPTQSDYPSPLENLDYYQGPQTNNGRPLKAVNTFTINC